MANQDNLNCSIFFYFSEDVNNKQEVSQLYFHICEKPSLGLWAFAEIPFNRNQVGKIGKLGKLLAHKLA